MKVFGASWLAVVLVVVLGVSAGAAPIAQDSFLIGSPAVPASGEYFAGDLQPSQGPAVLGFTGNWSGNTGTIEAASGGLTYSGLLTPGGTARYNYASNLSDYPRYVERSLDTGYDTARSTFYLAGLMSLDGNFTPTTSSTAYTAFLNGREGTQSLTLGVQWGFQGNGTGVDAVLRVRDDSSGYPVVNQVIASDVAQGTHLFVAKVERDFTGGSVDQVSVWLDPVHVSSEAAAGAPTLVDQNVCWTPPTPDDIIDTVVLNEFSVGANATVHYDELRFGEDWADLGIDPLLRTRSFRQEAGYNALGAELREGSPGDGLDTDVLTRTGTHTGSGVQTMRSVLAFDLSDIPAHAVITDATLTMTVASIVGEMQEVELRLIQHASETMDEATVDWLDVAGDTDWATAGGDFTDLLSTIPGFSDLGTKTFGSTGAFLATVRAAFANDMPLELILLSPDTEAAGGYNFVRWHSDDASSLGNRPVLSVSYRVPEPATCTLLALGAALLAVRRRRRA